MVSRASEYIGIAEGIRSRELMAKQRIEGLERACDELELLCITLEDRICAVEASISIELMCSGEDDDDVGGGPDFLMVHIMEEEKAELQGELDDARSRIMMMRDEISNLQEVLVEAQIEKDRTLVEIQDRAASNAANIAQVGGAVGAFASIGSKLQSSLRSTQDTLATAARILGGNINSAGGGQKGGIGSRRGGGGTGPAGAGAKPHPPGGGGGSAGSYTSAQSTAASPSSGTFSSTAAVKESVPKANYVSARSSGSVGAQNFKGSPSSGKGGSGKYQSAQRSGVAAKNAEPRKTAASPSQQTKSSTGATGKFRVAEYQATYSYTDPVTHERKTASSSRRVYEYTGLDMNLVVPVGTDYGNGRATKVTQTNLERMLNGKKPFARVRDENGNERLVLVELHHLTGEETLYSNPYFNGSKRDGTMVELPQDIHDKYDKQIHIQGVPSFRKSNGRKRDRTRSADLAKYTKFVEQYWRDRAERYVAAMQSESGGDQAGTD